MPPPKRNRVQIKKDRLEIAQLYIRGRYQSEIAEMMGLSQQQISHDLKMIQREWQRSTTIALDEHKNRELARIDHLEQTAWAEWEASRRETKTKTVKAKNANSTEKTLRTQEQCGDPRYLQTIQWCIEQRCKILGIYQQAELSGLVINLVAGRDIDIDNG